LINLSKLSENQKFEDDSSKNLESLIKTKIENVLDEVSTLKMGLKTGKKSLICFRFHRIRRILKNNKLLST